jgi:hypothetical protein
MEMSCQLQAPAALPHGERDPGTHLTGGWVGPRADLDDMENRQILPCRESNPGRPAPNPLLYKQSDTNGKMFRKL